MTLGAEWTMISGTSESRGQIDFTVKFPALLWLHEIDQKKEKQLFVNFIYEPERKHLIVTHNT